MNVPQKPDGGNRSFPGPGAIRTLATATATYEAMVKDAKTLIEDTLSEGTISFEDYGELLDNLSTALDPTEMGSVTMIAAACRRLLGESS